MTDQELLQAKYHYDPETGIFTWKNNSKGRGGIKAGDVVGCYDDKGRLRMRFNGKQKYGHVLAWLYIYGEWPSHEVDHRDCNPSNNRLKNLRPATRIENCRNTRIRDCNTSGHKGVYFHKPTAKWMAAITINRKLKYLGLFENINDAIETYRLSALKYFGEFCRIT